MGDATVSGYVGGLSGDGARAVARFMDAMSAEFPRMEPTMCYGMPMWRLGAKLCDGYVAVSAAKGHFSVHFHDEGLVSALAGRLPGCTVGKRCVNIRYGDEVSAHEVMRAVIEYVGG
ncbi:MAG: DUF1801 domain-containing protein, partial [Methanomassiliicoccaceae archaeon]|nr:DUF1801 domain-containing protein [Methanomassiliicoccaceae archaeon]